MVGDVANINAPLPVLDVATALARFALVGVASHVATPAPRPLMPVETGRPVALVSVPEEGVPSAPPLITGAPAVPTLTASAVATPVPRPPMPPTGTALAVTLVLHPNPLLVVQIKALEALLHPPTASAVGAADPAVALPTTVFVACVARLSSVT